MKNRDYLECPWYLLEDDKCHMPTHLEPTSECWAKRDGQLHDFCICLKNLIEKCKVDDSIELSEEEQIRYESLRLDDEASAFKEFTDWLENLLRG
jgi:hypothetical protein